MFALRGILVGMSGGSGSRPGDNVITRLVLDRDLPPSARARLAAGRTPCHCWAVDVPKLPPGTRPALLLEWRHGADGWRGLIVVALDDAAGGPAAVTLWVGGEHLKPAD